MTDSNTTNKNSFGTTVESLMKGMEGFLSSKTVIGEPVQLGNTTLLPLTDVSFGMGAGAFAGEKKRRTGGGIGGKISPTAVIVVQDGSVRMVNIKSQDGITKLIDMIPDFVNRFMDHREAKQYPEKAKARKEARAKAEEELKEKLDLETE
ncbi:hypothetical protein CXIVA_23000 [Clostridium sp. SY8519]|jgi:uncharacterized spore protein YtfJ|uniref:GerW family sporulation protein n=1 Tax=Clostridium sp. (strain SY8519) TaxID=1042156 RepID=UPI0002171EDB|nr:GerW family sporulation protein [Clostridium sp. SY8519]BAK48267.1 hypothetical protein CXIVA_23000 [Clostridium sp. SY8519]